MIDAIILCGGRAKRLGIDIPKPLIGVGEKKLIQRQIEWLRGSKNIGKIILAVGKSKDVFDYAKTLDNNVIVVYEDEPLGTGGALKNVLDNANMSEEFILINDDLANVDIDELLNIPGCVVCVQNPRSTFGVVEIDEENNVKAFREKLTLTDHWVSIGIVKLVKNEVYPNLPEKGDIEYETYPKLKMKVFKHNGYWYPINDKKQLEAANEFFSDGNEN